MDARLVRAAFHESLLLKNKILQLILISLDSTSWELKQHQDLMCGPLKIPNMIPAPRNRTWILMIVRLMLFLMIKDTTPYVGYTCTLDPFLLEHSSNVKRTNAKVPVELVMFTNILPFAPIILRSV